MGTKAPETAEGPATERADRPAESAGRSRSAKGEVGPSSDGSDATDEAGTAENSTSAGASRGERAPTGRPPSGAWALLARDRRASSSLSAQYPTNRLTTAVRATCFWVAIALPFLYVPLLVVGVETRSEGIALLVLLACNALTLVIGHSHRGR